MAEVKWIKVTTTIFDDEKIKLIDTIPDRDAIIVIWFKLLTLAGKTNENGLVYIIKEIPTTDEMLSTIFNRPLNTVRLALKTFEKFGMIEVKNHINVVNWEKHQNIEGLDKIRNMNAERQRKYRERKEIESNVTVTLRNAIDLDQNKNILSVRKTDDEYLKYFDFWNEQERLIHHKPFQGKMVSDLNTAVKNLYRDGLSEDDIKRAIKTYSEVLNSPGSFFSYRWTLLEFLSRKNGCIVFAFKTGEDYCPKQHQQPQQSLSDREQKETKQYSSKVDIDALCKRYE